MATDKILFVSFTDQIDDNIVNGVEIPHILSISEVEPPNCTKVDDISFSTSHPDDVIYTKELTIPNEIKELYFLVFGESGGGGSYRDDITICVEVKVEDVHSIVLNIFCRDHNADHDCEDCDCKVCSKETCKCLKRVMEELETIGTSEASSTYNECIDLSLFKIVI